MIIRSSLRFSQLRSSLEMWTKHSLCLMSNGVSSDNWRKRNGNNNLTNTKQDKNEQNTRGINSLHSSYSTANRDDSNRYTKQSDRHGYLERSSNQAYTFRNVTVSSSFERKGPGDLVSDLAHSVKQVTDDNGGFISEKKKIISLLLTDLVNSTPYVSSSKQSYWNKDDILSLLRSIGKIPFEILTATDISNVTNFVAKIITDKQIIGSTENNFEFNGVVTLLLLFLLDNNPRTRMSTGTSVIRQSSPRRSSTSPTKPQQHLARSSRSEIVDVERGSSKDIVLESLRVVALIATIPNISLQPLRSMILSTMLLFSALQCSDIESRIAAVDAIGSVLITSQSSPTSLSQEATNPNMNLLLSKGFPSKSNAVENIFHDLSLVELQDHCLWSIIENMRVSTTHLNGPEADASYSKLLVSCLRILIDIANASRQKKGVNTSKSDVKDEDNIDESAGSNTGNELIYYTTFAIQYASLVQSAFALFSKVLPQALAKIDGASSSEVGGALKQSGNELRSKASLLSGQTTEKKLCQHIFLFVSALATFNPSSFMSNWPLFLSDSLSIDKQLQLNTNEVVRAISARCQLSHSEQWAIQNGTRNSYTRPLFRSILFSNSIYSAHPSIRMAAFETLLSFLAGLPLRRWFLMVPGIPLTGQRDLTRSSETSNRFVGGANLFSDKASKFIVKILNLVVISLPFERDEGVFQRLLELVSVLVMNMPLAHVSVDGNQLASGLPVTANPAVSVVIPEYEGIALSLFHEIMTVASSEVLEPSSVSISSTLSSAHGEGALAVGTQHKVPASTRHCAIQWLCEFCKSTQRLESFVRAMSMCYCSSSPGPLTRSSFIYAISNICTRNVSIIGGNNALFNLSIRNLNNALLQLYPEQYLADSEWVRSLIIMLETNNDSALRLQGCRMIFSLLNKSLNDFKLREKEKASISQKYPLNLPVADLEDSTRDIASVRAAVRSLQETIKSLILSTMDGDHLVRGQAAAAIGWCLPAYWKLFCSNSTSIVFDPRDRQNYGLDFLVREYGKSGTDRKSYSESKNMRYISLWPQKTDVYLKSIRELIIERLLICAQDKVGTVRASSLKAIGDIVVNRGLQIGTYGRVGAVSYDESDGATLPNLDAEIISRLFDVCILGCRDSKLAVRLQAAWTVGNLLIAVLPFRMSFNSGTGEDKRGISWLRDEFWCEQFRLHFQLLADSEKIFPSATRALSVLICGLDSARTYSLSKNDENEQSFKLTVLVADMLTLFFQKMDCEMDGTPIREGQGKVASSYLRLERAIKEKPQKLVFSIVQAFGCVLWSICKSDRQKVDVSGRPDSLFMWRVEIADALVQVLRFGKTKLQLQSAQILLFFVTETNPEGGFASNEIITVNATLITRIIECCCIVTSSLLEKSAVSSSTSFGKSGDQGLPVESFNASRGYKEANNDRKKSRGDQNGVPSGEKLHPSVHTSGPAVIHEKEAGKGIVATLLAGRVKLLQRYLLVLLLAGYKQLHASVLSLRESISESLMDISTSCSHIQSKSAESLIYYADAFLAWLQIQYSDDLAPLFSSEELSIGLPKLSYDFSAKIELHNKSQKAIVGEICSFILCVLSDKLISNSSEIRAVESMSFFSSDSLIMQPNKELSSPSVSSCPINSLPRKVVSKLCQLAGEVAGSFLHSDILNEIQEPIGYNMFSGGLSSSQIHSEAYYWNLKDASGDESCHEEDDEDEI